MNINLHIERLVVDGLPATDVRDAAIQAAVEAELARLLTKKQLPRLSSGNVKNISGGEIRWLANNNSGPIGQQIAGAVHSSLRSFQPQTQQAHARRAGGL